MSATGNRLTKFRTSATHRMSSTTIIVVAFLDGGDAERMYNYVHIFSKKACPFLVGVA